MTLVWLLGAILAEVTGTIALRLSNGFSKVVPAVVVVVGYGFAFYALAQTLARGMSVGVAYGIWAGLGVTLVAIIGAVFLGEGLTWVQVGGIALVIAGVLALELGGAPG